MFTKKKEPFLIGVAGGISSGKSSVCRKIIEELELMNDKHKKQVLIISLDSFYKKLTTEQLQKAERGALNLDHPDCKFFLIILMYSLIFFLKQWIFFSIRWKFGNWNNHESDWGQFSANTRLWQDELSNNGGVDHHYKGGDSGRDNPRGHSGLLLSEDQGNVQHEIVRWLWCWHEVVS